MDRIRHRCALFMNNSYTPASFDSKKQSLAQALLDPLIKSLPHASFQVIPQQVESHPWALLYLRLTCLTFFVALEEFNGIYWEARTV